MKNNTKNEIKIVDQLARFKIEGHLIIIEEHDCVFRTKVST